MARAIISDVTDQIEGENVRLSWRTIFYGAPLATPDADLQEFVVSPGMARAQIKAGIKQTVQDRATALGYGNIGTPQHRDELFHNL